MRPCLDISISTRKASKQADIYQHSFIVLTVLEKMNWMTSAKNRLQRSSKSKSNNNLRMNASSKLPPSSRVKNSIIMHNFNPSSRREVARQTRNSESNDIWMLNNLSRNRRPEDKVHQKSASVVAEKKVDTSSPCDPLLDLDMTPSKRSNDDEAAEEQQIIFYNDGHLCDEMGNLILADAFNSTQRVARRRLFGPVGDRTPPESRAGQDGGKGPEGGSKSESPDESLNSMDSDDWWHRLITMLAHSTMAETYLHTVLAEIVPMVDTPAATVPSTVSGSTSALLQVAEGLEPPSAREVLDALYRALSKVGRDQRSSLIVFDAIRMLEIVDKQHSEPLHHSDTARAHSTASSFPRAATHRDPSNNNHNDFTNTDTNVTSYLNNDHKHKLKHKPHSYSQGPDSALDLATLLGNDSYYNTDTSYAHKENCIKPSTLVNASSNNIYPLNTNNSNTNSYSFTTRSDLQNDADWNLFDAPAAATITNTTKLTHPINSTTTSGINTNNHTTHTAGSSLLQQPGSVIGDKIIGLKRKVAGDSSVASFSHSTVPNSSRNRVSRDDVELRLEDLF